MIVPLIATIYLLIKYRDATKWWEFLILWAISPVCILGFDAISEMVTVGCTEWWGGVWKEVRWYQEWDEEVPCSHPVYCETTDSKGNTTNYQCGTEHIYDVDFHPEYFVAVTVHKTLKDVRTLEDGQVIYIKDVRYQIKDIERQRPAATIFLKGKKEPIKATDTDQFYYEYTESVRISKSQYRELKARWNSNEFVDLHRDYHSIDGDMYRSLWSGTKETAEPFATKHSYENRIKVSNSVFT